MKLSFLCSKQTALVRITMGFVIALMIFIPASHFTTPRPGTLGMYPTTPTLPPVTCLYSDSFFAAVAFFLTCTSNNRLIGCPVTFRIEGSRMKRGRHSISLPWRAGPLPFIGSLFPGGDGQDVARSAESNPLWQVYDSSCQGLEKVGIGWYCGRQSSDSGGNVSLNIGGMSAWSLSETWR